MRQLHNPPRVTTAPLTIGKSNRLRDPTLIVSVGVFDSLGRMLWGKRRDSGKWSSIGGHVNPGEDLFQAAARETQEEAGISADHSKLRSLGEPIQCGKYLVHCFRIDLPDQPTPTAQNDPDEEFAEFVWADVSDGELPREIATNLHANPNALVGKLGLAGVTQKSELSKAKQHPWHSPNLEEEHGEFERVAQEEGIPLNHLLTAAANSKVGPLDAQTWSTLDNTDSNDTNTPAQFHAKAKEYGRDSQSVANAFQNQTSLPAPIVLHRPGKNPTLVGGNTRLMGAKAFGVVPHVLHVHLPTEKAEPTQKALADIPKGPQKPGSQYSGQVLDDEFFQNSGRSSEGWSSHDYSHVLKPEHQQAGYSLTVSHDSKPGSKMVVAQLDHQGKKVGHAVGYLHDDNAIEVGGHIASGIDAGHSGKGLGVHLYEGLLAHAKNTLGAEKVKGGSHSTSAMRVHSALSRKHGLDYQPDPKIYGSYGEKTANLLRQFGDRVPDREKSLAAFNAKPEGPHDSKYSEYEYALKNEEALFEPVTKAEPTPRDVLVCIPRSRLKAVEEEEARVAEAVKRGHKPPTYFWTVGRLPAQQPRRVYFCWDGAVRAYHDCVGMIREPDHRLLLDHVIHKIAAVPMESFRGWRYWERPV